MDEPLSNLDAQLRAEMRREIRDLQKKLGITMVYVTHDQSEAMSMADKVILMREGKVEQAAAPDTIYARPESVFAARFIGTPPMNIVNLEATANGIVIAGTEVRVLNRPMNALLLGVRPEDVKIGDDGIPARVTNVEFMGADTMVACAIGNQSVTASVPGKAALSPGNTVHLGWCPDTLHFFDAASGRRQAHLTADGTRDTGNSVQNVLA